MRVSTVYVHVCNVGLARILYYCRVYLAIRRFLPSARDRAQPLEALSEIQFTVAQDSLWSTNRHLGVHSDSRVAQRSMAGSSKQAPALAIIPVLQLTTSGNQSPKLRALLEPPNHR